jgi:hypothetical protein
MVESSCRAPPPPLTIRSCAAQALMPTEAPYLKALEHYEPLLDQPQAPSAAAWG